jgi:photosystem II stability/assembly factor-like uncharacterized protein
MKRIGAIFAWMIVLSPLLMGAIAVAEEAKEGPFVIHQIAVDPGNPQILYAGTSNYGILKSTDGGTTWRLSNQGLGSYTHRAVAVDPLHPNIVYVGSWSGGVSKSVDRGAHWTTMNNGLGNTAIEDLVLDPINPEQLYVATTAGVFKSPDGGASWMAYSKGLPIVQIENFECLLVLPSGPTELFLGTSQGLFKHARNASEWEMINGVAREVHIIALAYEPKSHLLYAGTIKHGLLRSRDGGNSWAPLSGRIEKRWVSDLALDPQHPGVLYASTRGNGVFKSDDEGVTWREMNTGLPVKDIRSLAIDPKHPEIVYAGTTIDGLLKTRNGGDAWIALKGYPFLTFAEIVASMSITDRPRDHPLSLSIPPEFSKCNQCHGWADPLLNMKQTYWRVPPNRRDWTVTVNRMSQRARLTPEEARTIAEFLTRYTRDKQ